MTLDIYVQLSLLSCHLYNNCIIQCETMGSTGSRGCNEYVFHCWIWLSCCEEETLVSIVAKSKFKMGHQIMFCSYIQSASITAINTKYINGGQVKDNIIPLLMAHFRSTHQHVFILSKRSRPSYLYITGTEEHQQCKVIMSLMYLFISQKGFIQRGGHKNKYQWQIWLDEVLCEMLATEDISWYYALFATLVV